MVFWLESLRHDLFASIDVIGFKKLKILKEISDRIAMSWADFIMSGWHDWHIIWSLEWSLEILCVIIKSIKERNSQESWLKTSDQVQYDDWFHDQILIWLFCFFYCSTRSDLMWFDQFIVIRFESNHHLNEFSDSK